MSNLTTIRGLCSEQPEAFNERGLRNFIDRHKTELAESGALMTMGRKILIDKGRLFGFMSTAALNS